VGCRCEVRQRENKSPKATIGTTAIRNGRRTERASRSFSNRTGKEYEENRNTDVWVISAEGGQLTKISDHDEADNQPRWSPDGKWIAFTGEVHDRDHAKIWLAPATGGAPSALAANGLV